jgi:dolichol kinase
VPRDIFALLVSYVFVILVVAIAVFLRSARGVSPETTRKFVHVAVGTWVIPTVILFRSPWLAMIPPATFILVNLVSYRFKAIAAIEEGDRNPGTIYFPIAFVLAILLFWPGVLPVGRESGGSGTLDPSFPFSRFGVAAAIMAMAWGDAAASLIGRRIGRRRFVVPGGGKKSLEGMLAFFVFAFLGLEVAAIALLVVPGADGFPPGLTFGEAIAMAGRFRVVPIALTAAAGAVAEALTPLGLDNLTVPLVVGALIRFAFFA